MTTQTRAGWGLLLGLLVGCGTGTTFTPVANPPHRVVTKEADAVEVYFSNPKRAHTEIGRVTVEKDSQFMTDNDPRLLEQLREEAGDHGCDAIVIEEQRRTLDIQESSFAGPEASCIVWKKDVPAARF